MITVWLSALFIGKTNLHKQSVNQLSSFFISGFFFKLGTKFEDVFNVDGLSIFRQYFRFLLAI